MLEVESEFEHFLWSTGDTTTFLEVTEPGLYSVTGSNKFCDGRANFTIENCEIVVYIPNVITPSRSDGLNDYISIPEAVRSEILDFEFMIFDRWGEIFFATTDVNFVWDGTYKDKLVTNGVYNYLMKYTPSTGKPVVKRGSITVL